MKWTTMACASLAALLPAVAYTATGVPLLRDRAPEERPTLLVLGSAHFANPGQDLINIEVEDVLTERRQREIESVVQQLAAFDPTHVAVERDSSRQPEVDSRYHAYRGGTYELSRNEVEQLGFRLAAVAGNERVYAIDANVNSPGSDRDYDWYGYAQANEPERFAAISDPERGGPVLLGEQSIGAWLRQMNAPDRLAADHRSYFDIALIGDDERHVGVNWVGYWYARNLKIFENLVRLTDRPGDRVIIVYGAGHAYLLRQFAVESGAFRLVEVDDFLKER